MTSVQDPTLQSSNNINTRDHRVDIPSQDENPFHNVNTTNSSGYDKQYNSMPNSMNQSYGDEAVPSPIGDLSAYRSGMDDARQALWGPFGIFNQVTSIIVNFFVNVGALYGGAVPHDWVGVWRTPDSANPYGMQVWSDWLMTSILVVAGMGLLATPGQWASIWIGQARPVPGKYVNGKNASWYFRSTLGAYYPAGAKHFITRTILLVLQYSTVFYGIAMLIFFGMCKSYNIFAGPGAQVGAAPGRGHDPQCWIDPVIYTWVRAAVFTVFGAYVYPIAYVAALDVENVPAWALNSWKRKQEQKGLGGNNKPLNGYDQNNSYNPESQTRNY